VDETPTRIVELRRDVACSACGYNLRGLAVQGRCPECGQEVSVSLAEYVVPDAAAVAIDPRWRRRMTEAVVLALLGLGLALAGVLGWPGFIRPHGARSVVPMGLLSTWWMSQWWSAIRLTWRDPALLRPRWTDRLRAWGLRLSATAYLALPLLWEACLRSHDGAWVLPMRVALWSGPVAALAYFLQLAHVFARLSLPRRAGQAVVIGWLLALTLRAQMTSFQGMLTSEDVLAWAASFQFGSPGLLAITVLDVAYWKEPLPFAWFLLVPSLSALLLLLSLLVHLWRAGRKRE
jgi:hypothetical protein